MAEDKLSILQRLIDPAREGIKARRAQAEADANLKSALREKASQSGALRLSPDEMLSAFGDEMLSNVMGTAPDIKTPNLKYLKLKPGVQLNKFLETTKKMDPEDYGILIDYVKAVDQNPRVELGELGTKANLIADQIGISRDAGVKSVRNAFNALLDFASQQKMKALSQAENMGKPTGLPPHPVVNQPPFDLPYLGNGRLTK